MRTLKLLKKETLDVYTTRLLFKFEDNIPVIGYEYFEGNHGDWKLFYIPKGMKKVIEPLVCEEGHYKLKSSLMRVKKAEKEFDMSFFLDRSIQQALKAHGFVGYVKIVTVTESMCDANQTLWVRGKQLIDSTHDTQYFPVNRMEELKFQPMRMEEEHKN